MARRTELSKLVEATAGAYQRTEDTGTASWVAGRNFGAAVLDLGDRVLVAFPGTTPVTPTADLDDFVAGLRQWLTNLTIGQRRLGQARVHSGYLNEATALSRDIEQAVLDHGGAVKRVVFAGHSAGGAIAQVAAALLATDGGPVEVDRVYSFAAPRVGDSRFRELMDDRVIRFERRDDVVPHLPFSPRAAEVALSWIELLHELVPQLVTDSTVRILSEVEYLHAGPSYWYDWDGDWIYTAPGGYLRSVYQLLTDSSSDLGAVPMPKWLTDTTRFTTTLGAVAGMLALARPSFLLDHHIVHGIGHALSRRR